MTHQVQFPNLGISVEVNPIAFQVGNFTIYWYGIIIGIGFLLAVLYGFSSCKKMNINKDHLLDAIIAGLLGGIIGARLYYVIFYLSLYRDGQGKFQWSEAIAIWDGGLAIYGGVIGGILTCLVVCKHKKLPFLAMADLSVMGLFIGQIMGRWGNFVNQEAYGNPVTDPSLQWFPYAVKIDAAHSITGKEGWFQATFFYESFWNLIGFGLLMLFYNGNRKSFDGFTFSCYCIWYGCGRFFIEGLRTDSLWLVPGVIRVSQVVSALIFLFGVAYVVTYICRARASGKKLLLFVPEEKLSDEYYGYEKTEFYLRTLKPSPEEAKKEEDDGPQFDEVSPT